MPPSACRSSLAPCSSPTNPSPPVARLARVLPRFRLRPAPPAPRPALRLGPPRTASVGGAAWTTSLDSALLLRFPFQSTAVGETNPPGKGVFLVALALAAQRPHHRRSADRRPRQERCCRGRCRRAATTCCGSLCVRFPSRHLRPRRLSPRPAQPLSCGPASAPSHRIASHRRERTGPPAGGEALDPVQPMSIRRGRIPRIVAEQASSSFPCSENGPRVSATSLALRAGATCLGPSCHATTRPVLFRLVVAPV
ncbi:hypothetical protein RJ55_04522 [Drechmeria coniospora]|nr:hypothetical protein RJ55_04522 [Drechmeria coniospora]